MDNSDAKMDVSNEQDDLLEKNLCDGTLEDIKTPDEMNKKPKPERVVNIRQLENRKELVCLVKYDNSNKLDYVPQQWANENCPELVIAFYESRIYWRTPSGISKYVPY